MTPVPCRWGTLSCIASLTPKTCDDQNEDAATIIPFTAGGFQGLAIADGLGSFSFAREAAQFAVKRAAELAKSLHRAADLPYLFTAVRNDLRIQSSTYVERGTDENTAFGTTLIVALETTTQLIVAYAGNGAIWHMRGNYDEYPQGDHLPWTPVNYLCPHSVAVGGRESLYNILAPSNEYDTLIPSVITVDKDARFGDIILLCTDGIYSADQVPQGTDSSGKVWLEAAPSMIAFYRHFHAYLERRFGDKPSADIEDAMQKYLLQLKTDNVLEDDATLGLLVTETALDYQSRRRATAQLNA